MRKIEKKVQRLDFISLEKATFTAEGFLRDAPVVTKVGIFEYRNPDQSIRREFRPPDEVFREDSLQSLMGKPITLRHPSSGTVTGENARQLAVGTVLSPGRADGDFVRADLVIHDAATVRSGKRGLSCGYNLDLDMTPGEYNGMRYDCIQRNIRYNHLAVVDSGRAGVEARLNLDGDQIIDEEEDKPMPKIRLDNGIEYDAAPEVVVAYEKLRQDNTTLNNTLTETKRSLDTTEAERDTLKARVDGHAVELDKVRKDADEKIGERVKARVALLDTAKKFNVDKADGLTDRQVKEAVIKAVRGDDKLDLSGKSDDYVNAAFDMAAADGTKRLDAMATQRQKLNGGGEERKDEGPKSAAEARDRMIESQQDAWKGEKK